jgi:hypothetical protein
MSSQEPATGPYPEPNVSNPHPNIVLLRILQVSPEYSILMSPTEVL